jgi:hypothetical protein
VRAEITRDGKTFAQTKDIELSSGSNASIAFDFAEALAGSGESESGNVTAASLDAGEVATK